MQYPGPTPADESAARATFASGARKSNACDAARCDQPADDKTRATFGCPWRLSTRIGGAFAYLFWAVGSISYYAAARASPTSRRRDIECDGRRSR